MWLKARLVIEAHCTTIPVTGWNCAAPGSLVGAASGSSSSKGGRARGRLREPERLQRRRMRESGPEMGRVRITEEQDLRAL